MNCGFGEHARFAARTVLLLITLGSHAMSFFSLKVLGIGQNFTEGTGRCHDLSRDDVDPFGGP